MHKYPKNPPPQKPGYWGAREHMQYYKTAITLAKKHILTPSPSILDIGGRDCLYSLNINSNKRVTVDPEIGPQNNLIYWIKEDFLIWGPDEIYDLTFCLQVLEHVENPKIFLEKILKWSRVAIVSVPFNWPAVDGHLHNNLQLNIFEEWAGIKPEEIIKVEEIRGNRPPEFWGRIIAVFKNKLPTT